MVACGLKEYKLEKCFPLLGERAYSLKKKIVCTLRGWSFQKQNRKEGETEQQQTYQFTKGYSNFHRLQVHHLTHSLSYTLNIYQ